MWEVICQKAGFVLWEVLKDPHTTISSLHYDAQPLRFGQTHLNYIYLSRSFFLLSFTSHNPPLINPHTSASLTTLLLKMVIQMIIWDFTIIKGRRGDNLHIQIIAQIIYVNMTKCFVSRRNSFLTAAGGGQRPNHKKYILLFCFATADGQ